MTFFGGLGSVWDGNALELFDRGVPIHTLYAPQGSLTVCSTALSVALGEVACPHAHLHREVFRCVRPGHGPPRCRDCFSFHGHDLADAVCCECGEVSTPFVPVIQTHRIVARGRTDTLHLVGAVMCTKCARRQLP